MTIPRPWQVFAFAAALALVFAASGAADDDGRPLTLEEAIVLALEKNEGIFIERRSLAAADAAVDGAHGAYDPVLGVEAGWRRATEPVNSAFSGAPEGRPAPTDEAFETRAAVRKLLPTGGEISLRAASSRATTDGAFGLLSPAYTSQVGVELRQPLLRDREIDAGRLGLRVAGADRERAAASLTREVADTVAAVEQAYWTLTAVRQQIGVNEDTLALAEQQLAETELRIESGAAPETEIAQPRAEIERRRGELLASQEAAARAENTLKLLILGDGDGDLWSRTLAPVAPAAAEIVPVDVAAALAQALASRPELTAASAVVERRRAETAFARDGVRPDLDVVASYDRYGLAGSRNPAGGVVPGLPSEVPPGLEGGWGQSFDVLGGGDFDDARLALVLELPIGNRAARAAAAAARNGERQAAADLARARKAVRAQVLDAAAALETTAQRIAAARAARAAAEVQLAAERDRFAVGLSTNFLVLTRQNDLAGSRLAEIAALTDYRSARTEMARATGTLLAERGIQVSSLTDTLE